MWQGEMTETAGKIRVQIKNCNFQNFRELKRNDVQLFNCKAKELLTFAKLSLFSQTSFLSPIP